MSIFPGTSSASHKIWLFITHFGDMAVLVPCAAIAAAWMAWSPSSRSLALRWVAVFLTTVVVVAASKLIYMAWNVGVRALDFTGISGHSAGAMTVWPVLAWMLAYERGRRGRIIGLCFGLLLALAIALSRIVLHAHSVAEVVGGVIMGLVMISIFLFHEASLRLPRCKACLLLPLFMVVMVMHGRSFPSEWLLQQLALQLSSDGTTYTRHFRR